MEEHGSGQERYTLAHHGRGWGFSNSALKDKEKKKAHGVAEVARKDTER